MIDKLSFITLLNQMAAKNMVMTALQTTELKRIDYQVGAVLNFFTSSPVACIIKLLQLS